MNIEGARRGARSGLRRLAAAALARDLHAFVVPGPEIARVFGLDLAAAGLRLATTPRHASVLLTVGPLPGALRDAVSVVYAQMPRPRAILALGSDDLTPLPAADVNGALSQDGLLTALAGLRRVISLGAFSDNISDFDAPALQVRIDYTCPMHPEVVSDKPGSCPKCGMTLMPREKQGGPEHSHTSSLKTEADMTNRKMHVQWPDVHDHSQNAGNAAAQYTCPMHPEVVSDKPGSCPKCGMHLVPVEKAGAAHAGHDHGGHEAHAMAETAQYTCPMHPEVVSDKPGSCPKCGMHLVPVEKAGAAHAGHDQDHAVHSATIDGVEPHFMSMIDVTKDLPASGDGLRMDWIDVPFGPFFPGLPGGLTLSLTLDGDTVANSAATSLVGGGDLLNGTPATPEEFVTILTALSPLTPAAFRCLACVAIENAAGIQSPLETARGRAGALERERIASHLGWLSQFGVQTGFGWLTARAARLQLAVQDANPAQIAALAPAIMALLRRLTRTPLLRARLSGIGRLVNEDKFDGPVGRANGQTVDARNDNPAYAALGFIPVSRSGGDALDRFWLRLDEIAQSLALIAEAGVITTPALPDNVLISRQLAGDGEAVVETPRGPARLRVRLDNGEVVEAALDTPSTRHLHLIGEITEQQELGDALVAIGSLDLSPWEMRV